MKTQMKTKVRKKSKKKERLGNRLAIIGITVVVASLALAVNLQSADLKAKEQEYSLREESLQKQIEEEANRAAKLEEYRIYVDTNQYIEKVAKEKLGLVKPGEIILKPDTGH